MPRQTEIRYTVKKLTIGHKMCTTCGGTGKIEVKVVGGAFKNQPCAWCLNGVAKIEHITEIDLVQALTELGIRFVLPQSMKPKTDE
jgi:hypothetical protein